MPEKRVTRDEVPPGKLEETGGEILKKRGIAQTYKSTGRETGKRRRAVAD